MGECEGQVFLVVPMLMGPEGNTTQGMPLMEKQEQVMRARNSGYQLVKAFYERFNKLDYSSRQTLAGPIHMKKLSWDIEMSQLKKENLVLYRFVLGEDDGNTANAVQIST